MVSPSYSGVPYILGEFTSSALDAGTKITTDSDHS